MEELDLKKIECNFDKYLKRLSDLLLFG